MRRLLHQLTLGLVCLASACIWTNAYPDADGDGATSDVDCDDSDPLRNPSALERCNLLDDDCDGLYDEEAIDTLTWFWDQDGDGYGDASSRLEACWQPEGFVEDDQDCDDQCPSCAPGLEEVCDELDNDCDGEVDENGASGSVEVFIDADGDGYGEDGSGREACAPDSEEVEVDGDCDDADTSVYPGAIEVCGDGLDQDCDGQLVDCQVDLEDGADAQIRGVSFRDGLGTAVLGPGDLDNDGFTDVLLSAPYSDDYGPSTGSVYLFNGPLSGELGPESADRGWLGQQSYDQIGGALGVLPDQNGDSVPELVFGAPQASRGAGGEGYVCVQRATATWAELCRYAVAEINGAHTGDRLGIALSGDGDIDGDGIHDLVVGAPYDPSGGSEAGAALVFYGPLSGSLDGDDASLTWLGDAGARAGHSLSIAGDLDGDGTSEIVVGGPTDNAGAGRAWIVEGTAPSGQRLDLVAMAQMVGVSVGDQLGTAVGGVGDLDDDGEPELAVGAWLVSQPEQDHTGAVYVFGASQLGGTVDPDDAWAIVGSYRPHSFLGTSLAAAGDFDGSGLPDLLVGGTSDPVLSDGAGVAVLILDPTAGFLDTAVTGPALVGGGAGERAGAAVAGVGDTDGDGLDDVVVGAPAGLDGQGTVSLVRGMSSW